MHMEFFAAEMKGLYGKQLSMVLVNLSNSLIPTAEGETACWHHEGTAADTATWASGEEGQRTITMCWSPRLEKPWVINLCCS